jgi:hypothetical protein
MNALFQATSRGLPRSRSVRYTLWLHGHPLMSRRGALSKLATSACATCSALPPTLALKERMDLPASEPALVDVSSRRLFFDLVIITLSFWTEFEIVVIWIVVLVFCHRHYDSNPPPLCQSTPMMHPGVVIDNDGNSPLLLIFFEQHRWGGSK